MLVFRNGGLKRFAIQGGVMNGIDVIPSDSVGRSAPTRSMMPSMMPPPMMGGLMLGVFDSLPSGIRENTIAKACIGTQTISWANGKDSCYSNFASEEHRSAEKKKYQLALNQKREAERRIVEQRRAEERRIVEQHRAEERRIREEDQRRALAARQAMEERRQTEARNRYRAFARKHDVDLWVDQTELAANPFSFEDKVVALKIKGSTRKRVGEFCTTSRVSHWNQEDIHGFHVG